MSTYRGKPRQPEAATPETRFSVASCWTSAKAATNVQGTVKEYIQYVLYTEAAILGCFLLDLSQGSNERPGNHEGIYIVCPVYRGSRARVTIHGCFLLDLSQSSNERPGNHEGSTAKARAFTKSIPLASGEPSRQPSNNTDTDQIRPVRRGQDQHPGIIILGTF